MSQINEVAAFVRNNVEFYEDRLQLALNKMDRSRCPLKMADRDLYGEIIDVACEWFDDQEISIENDMDWDEFIEGDNGIIWQE